VGNPRPRSRFYRLGLVARVVQAAVGNSRRFNRPVGLEWVRELSTDAALSTDLFATCAGRVPEACGQCRVGGEAAPVASAHRGRWNWRAFSTAAWTTRAVANGVSLVGPYRTALA